MSLDSKVPREFFWRRMHSLTGFWLAIFLIIHLVTNSQAALFFGDDGKGFVHEVNGIHNLPYLSIIELFLLGVPILIHMIWGIVYLRTGKLNSFGGDGTTPTLPQYSRNQGYSWQRITSWVLLILLVGHIVQMRFLNYPSHATKEGNEHFMVRVEQDPGIYTVASRLKVKLYNQEEIEAKREQVGELTTQSPGIWSSLFGSSSDADQLLIEQESREHHEWVDALEAFPLQPGEVIAVAPDFGTAELLVVRDTFKSPLMLALYTLFVLSAVYHGFNGLWSFLITWGVNVTSRSQTLMRRLSITLMVLIGFLGLAAVWGTYWINLIQ